MKIGFDGLIRLKMQCYTMLPCLRAFGPYVGMAVYEDQSLKISAFVILMLAMNLFPALIKLYMSLSDVNLIVTIMSTISTFSLSFGFVILTIVNKKNFVKLLDEVTADFDVEFANATKFSKRHMLEASLYVFMQFACCGSAVIIYAIMPFTAQKLEFVYPSWYPWDTENTFGCAVVYCIQMGGGVFLCAIFVIGLCCILSIMGQSCMHLENLSITLRTRLDTEMKSFQVSGIADPESENLLLDFLAKCVERHVQLLSRRIRLMEITFSKFFLFGLLSYLGTVSASSLDLLTFQSGQMSWHNVKYGTVVFTGLAMVYPPCQWGNMIVSAQIGILPAIYNHSNVLFSPKAQRTLSIITMRANQPIYLTVAGIGKLDLAGCSQAIGLTYTIFMLLLHFKTNVSEKEYP